MQPEIGIGAYGGKEDSDGSPVVLDFLEDRQA